MRFLLGTNIISELRRRDRADPNVARWVALTPAEEIGTSIIVLAEIRRGIELKRRRDPEQARSLDRWFRQMRSRLGDRVLPVNEPIADAWAVLGVPNALPLIDGLLAATERLSISAGCDVTIGTTCSGLRPSAIIELIACTRLNFAWLENG